MSRRKQGSGGTSRRKKRSRGVSRIKKVSGGTSRTKKGSVGTSRRKRTRLDICPIGVSIFVMPSCYPPSVVPFLRGHIRDSYTMGPYLCQGVDITV